MLPVFLSPWPGRRLFGSFGTALIAASFAVTATAQTSLTLQEALASALRDHPLLAAGQDRIDVAQGVRRQAGLLLNPRLILQNENVRPYGNPGLVFWRDTDNFAYLQQTFETGGKRARRVEASGAAVTRAQLERDVTAFQIVSRVRQAYWAAAGARKAQQLLAESIANFQRIIEYHEVRVREGAMAEADLLRVRLEGDRLQMALNAAALESERTRIHLLREMGRRDFPPVDFSDPLEPSVDSAVAIDVDGAVNRRPEVLLARGAVEQARAVLRVEEASAKPNLDVLFGYKRTNGLNAMIGGVHMDLPFSNRNQGNIAAAASEIRFAESSLAATEALVRAEVNAAERDYELRRGQIHDALPAMRRQAAETARIADAAYREGGTDLLRLLDAQRLQIETELLYYRALAEYQQSAAALESAMGVMP